MQEVTREELFSTLNKGVVKGKEKNSCVMYSATADARWILQEGD